jgi:hypothetical protein
VPARLPIVQQIRGRATELARERAQHAHYRSSSEIADQLSGDPEDARRVVTEIAACRAEFIIADAELIVVDE